MILTRLKQETQVYRDRLEQHSYVISLTQPDVTLEDYTEVLRLFYGFYAPIETIISQMAAWQSVPLNFERRRKTPLLERDLRAFGATDLSLQTIPRCTDLPILRSFAHALGSMYALEDATLDKQPVIRHLQSTLSFDGGRGCAFFTRYGLERGAMWRAFGSFVGVYAATRTLQSAIIAAACDTYNALEHWFDLYAVEAFA